MSIVVIVLLPSASSYSKACREVKHIEMATMVVPWTDGLSLVVYLVGHDSTMQNTGEGWPC